MQLQGEGVGDGLGGLRCGVEDQSSDGGERGAGLPGVCTLGGIEVVVD
jgi:hypothetical protein